MRLLLFSERFPPDIGGVARSASRIARRMASLGHEVHVMSWTKMLQPGSVDSQQAESTAAITIHRMGMFGALDLTMQHTLNVVEWLHEQHQFDAVWGHYLYPAGFCAVTMAQWLGLPCTVSARGNDVDRLMFPPGDFARLLWTLGRADVVSAVSHELAQKIQMLTGQPRETVVLGNAVDADTFAPGPPDEALRTELGIGPPELVLGFSGELRHKKGLPFLLSALAQIRESRPACLLVIGSIRAREQSSLASYLAEAPEAASRIIVTGSLDSPSEVARRLRLCDVFLQPSMWDGMPNALLEAMACERLVVASDAGGITEVVEHQRSGWIIPRAHLHRTGDVVMQLLDAPAAEREAMQKAARRRVLDTCGAEQETAALEKVLGALASA